MYCGILKYLAKPGTSMIQSLKTNMMKKSGVVVLSLGLGQTALEAHWLPLVTSTCVYSQPVHK